MTISNCYCINKFSYLNWVLSTQLAKANSQTKQGPLQTVWLVYHDNTNTTEKLVEWIVGELVEWIFTRDWGSLLWDQERRNIFPPNQEGYHHHHHHLGFVHPLQDVALHQCLPLSSVCCFLNPGGSLLLCYVILPSSVWSSSGPLPSPWLPLCASLCPPIVL